MANYSSKMRVFQNWGAASTGEVGEQNVFVFGPRFSLRRYTDESEKEQMTPYAFESTGEKTTIKNVVETSASYELRSLEVYAENAYVNMADIDTANIYIEGSYLDGVLMVRGDDVAIKADDYLGIKNSTGVSFIKVVKVIKHNDAEYEYGTWLEVRLATGLPDDFADGTAAGVTVFVAKLISSVKVNDSAVSNTGADVTFDPAGAVNVDGVDHDLVTADLYFSTKHIYTGSSSGIQLATSIAEVEEVLGPADPDNPIAMGVYNAFIGGAPVVYYYVTEGDKLDTFKKALDRATLNSTLYYIVPMSSAKDVQEAVIQHVKDMSNETIKRWRIAVMCKEVDHVVVKEDLSVTGNGVYSVQGVTYKTLQFAEDVGDVVDGDTITVEGTEFKAVKRLNLKTVLTHSEDDGEKVTGAATISHNRSASEYAKAVAGSAKNTGTFRCVDVFPKTYGFGGETYSSVYLAPIVAGLAASVDPQAPITNATVPGVDDLPDIYNGYSTTDLDTIAAGGVLIVAQDQLGERCYVRKQLTTGTAGGVLAQTELSMVKNYDSISHYFNTIMEGFKGSYNVTDTLLQRVWTDLKHGVYVLQNNSVDDNIGPQLLEGSRVVKVEIDPTNRTKINAYVECDLPAPFNDMDLYLSVVTTELAVVTE